MLRFAIVMLTMFIINDGHVCYSDHTLRPLFTKKSNVLSIDSAQILGGLCVLNLNKNREIGLHLMILCMTKRRT